MENVFRMFAKSFSEKTETDWEVKIVMTLKKLRIDKKLYSQNSLKTKNDCV